MTGLAPIALFVYNRPWHTRRTIEALLKNEMARESEIYIFSDGAKGRFDNADVKKVREHIRSVEGFRHIKIIERENNLGLADNIISGVTEVVNKYGRIIVLEDDLVTHPQFLEFMNGALEKYEEERNVFSITGYSYTDNTNEELTSTYFLKLTSSWSWATWGNRWSIFDRNATGWEELKINKGLKDSFDFDGSLSFSRLMEHQLQGKIDSWAISWYWSVFKKGGLTLYPRESLINNIGFDGSGTHCKNIKEKHYLSKQPYNFVFEERIYENKFARQVIVKKLKDRLSIKKRILNRIRNKI